MKVIKIHHPHSFSQTDFPPLAIALGFFDGVHRGHQKVIQTAKRIADDNGWKSAVMTFDPHPSVVLGKENKEIQYITPLNDKIKQIERMDIDYLFIVRFTSGFADLSPKQFVTDYLFRLNVHHVIAGFDYTYGKYGKGTMETFPKYAEDQFAVTTVSKLEQDDEKISSTMIRKLLKEGNTNKAMELLGRCYTVNGTVIHGDKRGRTIGFPTANIQVEKAYLIPKVGVYAVRVKVGNQWINGVCNVGYKPTFKDPTVSDLSVEAHLLNFSSNIYGEEVIIEWHKRIRDEQKFSGIEELKKQIQKDKQETIIYFERETN